MASWLRRRCLWKSRQTTKDNECLAFGSGELKILPCFRIKVFNTTLLGLHRKLEELIDTFSRAWILAFCGLAPGRSHWSWTGNHNPMLGIERWQARVLPLHYPDPDLNMHLGELWSWNYLLFREFKFFSKVASNYTRIMKANIFCLTEKGD